MEFYQSYISGFTNKPALLSRCAFRSKRQAGQAALDAGIIGSAWDTLHFLKETCYTRTGKPFTGYRIIKPEEK